MIFAGACFITGCGGCGCDDECAEVQDTNPDDEKKPHTETVLDFPNEEKIGLPLYKENPVVSSIESTTEESDGVLTNVGVDFTTKDDFKTVANWYKEQMGGPPTKSLTTEDGNQQMTWESSADGYYNLIVLTERPEGTAVSVIKTKE